MNTDEITLSQALEGYNFYAEARQLSKNTLADYNNTFTKFQNFLGDDLPLSQIKKENIQKFLASYNYLKKKTILNYHIGLSALWTWAIAEGFIDEHIVRKVDAPKPEQPAIDPFTEQDVKLMLVACSRSRSYFRSTQREKCSHALPNSKRNVAIILTLLDTGMRASELCNSKIANADLKNRKITIYGKGDKERTVYISNKTSKAIWRYLITRPDASDGDSLFASSDGLPISRCGLRRLTIRIGQKADVGKANPHRFRHTFAINFLRNGGNAIVLQELLGHSSLDMVKRYVKIANTDCAQVHHIASPVANWDI